MHFLLQYLFIEFLIEIIPQIGPKECPRVDQIRAELAGSARRKRIQDENEEFFRYLTNVTGGGPYNLDNVRMLNDAHYCEVTTD